MSTVDSDALVARAARGFGWIFAWRMTTRLLGTANTLLLVRLLAPADFGLIALSSSFLAAIESFSTLGVEEAVVRAHAPGRDVYDTAFTMIAIRSATIAAALALAAHPLAVFFAEPRVVPVLYVTAGLSLLAGFENVGVLDFRREMRFEREFALALLPRLAGVAASIAIALWLRNYWALVIGTAVQRTLRMPLSYLMHPYRPRPSLAAWRELVGFTFWTWLLCLMRLARDRTLVFVLQRVLGTAQLGLFSIAGEIATLPASELVLPMGRAMFSAVSLARRGGGDSETIFLRMLGLMAIVTFPAGAGLALAAGPLVRLMLGAQWLAAVAPLQVIAAVGAIAVFDHCCHIQFDASGLVRLDFQVASITATLRLIAALLLVPPYGLAGAAATVAIGIVADQVVYLVTKRRVLAFSGPAILGQVWRPGLAAAGMVALVLASGAGVLPEGADAAIAAWRLLATATLGALTYVALILLAWVASGRPPGAEMDVLGALERRLRLAFAGVRA